MSRPFRFLLPAVFVASAIGFSGCVGTLYDETYSYHKNHFKAPKEAPAKEASPEAILGALEKKTDGAPDANAPAGLPPAGDIPGLPPTAPAPDAGAPAVPPPAAPPAAPPPNN